jgi:peptide/nickel transport system substrate-binding protein
MSLPGNPVNLDPHKNGAFNSLFAWEHTYQSLVAFDDGMKVVPSLALSWETPDPLAYNFKLRQGVKFHDGSEFTSDDVVFWNERLNAPATGAPYRSWFDAVTKVTAVDKYTAKFELKYPYSPLLANLASMRGSAIIPRKWATATGNIDLTAVGTGPYKISDFVANDHYVWDRNPDYYDKDLPYIDRVDHKLLPDESARIAALQSGQVAYGQISGAQAERLKSRPELNVLIGQKVDYVHLQFNCSKPPFNDRRVRQAVMLALEPKEIIDKVVGGFGDLTGPVPTGHTDWFIPPAELPKSLTEIDLTKAKQLMADAGFAAGGLKVTYKAIATNPPEVPIGVILKNRLQPIGIDVEIIQLDVASWIAQTQPPTSDYQVRMNGTSFYPDADGYLYNHYFSTSTNNQVRISDKTLDDLVTQARQLLDHEARRKLYFQVQQRILDEAYIVPLYNGKNIEILSSKVKGYKQSYTGRRLTFARSWLES